MHEIVIAIRDRNGAGTSAKSGVSPFGRGEPRIPSGGGGGAAGGGLSMGGFAGSVIEVELVLLAEEVVGGGAHDFFGNASIAQP